MGADPFGEVWVGGAREEEDVAHHDRGGVVVGVRLVGRGEKRRELLVRMFVVGCIEVLTTGWK